MRSEENIIIGRNPIMEAQRAGRPIERIFVREGLSDGPVRGIVRTARKEGVRVEYVDGGRLDHISHGANHQGVVAYVAAISYVRTQDILKIAYDKGEDPFIILTDGIEDPHNLGAIIRTANVAGAHGVIIPKNRSASLTATAVSASAGAANHTPVARVVNIRNEILRLKEDGLWFVCADMGGVPMYDLNLTGPIGLVLGGEGKGVSRMVAQSCDMTAAIPQRGKVGSLNVSVAAGVLAYEIVRQRIAATPKDI